MSYCKLTICFEAPFWIGLVETDDDEEGYRAAKHVFGAEPTDPQVGEFIHDQWKNLRFSDSLQVEKRGGKKINHKRMQRIIAKEVAANAHRGTKAQQALSEAREAGTTARKQKTKAQRDAEKQARFVARTEKRKQKHRGH